MRLAVLTIAALLGLCSTAFADCLDTAKKDIEQKGFTVEEDYLDELAYPANGGTTGYRAWFRVKECEAGYLIVNMHPNCGIRDHWAAGRCETPEIHKAIGESG